MEKKRVRNLTLTTVFEHCTRSPVLWCRRWLRINWIVVSFGSILAVTLWSCAVMLYSVSINRSFWPIVDDVRQYHDILRKSYEFPTIDSGSIWLIHVLLVRCDRDIHPCVTANQLFGFDPSLEESEILQRF